MDRLPSIEEQKTALNAQVKAATRKHLRAKSWPEKIESIERMNAAQKIGRAAMQKALNDKTTSASE